MNKTMTFVEERVTKNTIRFQEEVGELEAPTIGTLYVHKQALKEIGYQTGGKLKLTLEVAK